MCTFIVPLGVGDPSGRYFTPVQALVDTGSSQTFLPEDLLEDMGVRRGERRRFSQADESIKVYPTGQTWLRLNGGTLVALVVFGPKEAIPLLGATTLGIFGLGLDPHRQRLVRVIELLK